MEKVIRTGSLFSYVTIAELEIIQYNDASTMNTKFVCVRLVLNFICFVAKASCSHHYTVTFAPGR